MKRDDLFLSLIIGSAVGIFVQPIISSLSGTLLEWGIVPTPQFRAALLLFLLALAPFALLIAEFLSRIRSVIYQFAKFAAVGTLNVAIDFGILNLLIGITGVASGLLFSVFKATSFLIGTTNSFFWNKLWTFESNGGMKASETAKFYTIAVLGLVLNVAAASFVVNIMGPPEGVSPKAWANVGALVGVGVSFMWNFLGYKFVVFKVNSRDIVD